MPSLKSILTKVIGHGGFRRTECANLGLMPRFFLCIQDNQIIGFCWTKIHHDFVNVAPFGELYVIGVHPDYSGQGIGKAVCTEGLIYLKEKGINQAMLYVDEDNESGKRLYKALGFS
jgi:mycothiol synthase